MTGAGIGGSIRGVEEYLRVHPDAGYLPDSGATATLQSGLRCRVQDPEGHTVFSDMPPVLGGEGSAPTPGTFLRFRSGILRGDRHRHASRPHRNRTDEGRSHRGQ
jgi:hypothetical protein